MDKMNIKLGNNSNLLSKMDKSDWLWLFTYILMVLVVTVILDVILHIGGTFVILLGIIMGGTALRTRLLNKK